MPPHPPPPLTGVLESSLYADDLTAAERFYREILGLALIGRVPGRHVFLRCGSGVLLIFDPQAVSSYSGDVPPHGARGAGHLAFAVAPGAEALDGWRERLRAAGVPIEAEVDWPRGGRSIYFRDPAGNSIELAPPSIWDLPHPR